MGPEGGSTNTSRVCINFFLLGQLFICTILRIARYIISKPGRPGGVDPRHLVFSFGTENILSVNWLPGFVPLRIWMKGKRLRKSA